MASYRVANTNPIVQPNQKSRIVAVQECSVMPPNQPWQELRTSKDSYGYVSIYYSDNLSPLPIRWVTKPGDNKSDPNLETATYGLFSTCSPRMRSGVVNRASEYLFFATARKGERVLTGYYHLLWYAQGIYEGERDYCLAADRIRFIAEPIPLKKVDQICGTNVSKWFRNMRLLNYEQCKVMAALIDTRADATKDYLEEIDRLERFNLKHSGYRYPSWKRKEKFSWQFAQELLNKGPFKNLSGKVLNSSPSGSWQCETCSETIKNKALLKKCPNCGSIGTLKPL